MFCCLAQIPPNGCSWPEGLPISFPRSPMLKFTWLVTWWFGTAEPSVSPSTAPYSYFTYSGRFISTSGQGFVQVSTFSKIKEFLWNASAKKCFTVSSIPCVFFRRRRLCYDIPEKMWIQYQRVGEVLLSGYLFHFLPFFFVDRTLFLHHYLPAYAFKVKQSIY